ncbi:aminotransferase class V-fold PLP-dependent enzyme [Verminephrobacter aporrectodeae subsp. tuberculatae]|uniref:pyridoxal phosphate-dependent decarboxylase family protein n=1 Tax=Verminephrobacter aporrectodeae TaxID=1110389 RepID=UPI002244A5B8|nr:aminotransferase class V-fold PLP-dependent enzyme [Verminephrobacter aporrectodeae]MCW8198192.1 aminotransferase class V-fold PLP-dependent enzyme [Verminephrobacter aporrectodeae subsp. tuberculatae]
MKLSEPVFWETGQERCWTEQIDALVHRYRQQGRSVGLSATPTSATRVPEQPMGIEDYLGRLAEDGLAEAACMHHPRCLGHMTSPLPVFMPQLSRLVTSFNQNLMKTESSGGLTALERNTLVMLHRTVFDLDEQSYHKMSTDSQSTPGLITSGGTLANLTAMWCARKRGFTDQGTWWRQLHEKGYTDAVILGSRLMHYSFDKAMDLLGLSSNALLKIDVDARGAMRLDQLDTALATCRSQRRKVLAIVGIAGSTDFGSIDPLQELACRARMEGVHFHVDAAWGGPFLFSHTHAQLLAGIEQADTVTLDAHKQLLTPLGTGILLYRNSDLSRMLLSTAPYAVRSGSRDSGRFTLEGSRPANAIYLHAALHLIGGDGFGRYIDDSFERARALAHRIKARPDMELLQEPPTNLVVFRYLPRRFRHARAIRQDPEINTLNVRLHKLLRHSGTSFLSRTERVLPGQATPACVMLRAVMFNPLCRIEDIDPILDEVVACGRQLEEQGFEKEKSLEHVQNS